MQKWYEMPGALDGLDKAPAFREKMTDDDASVHTDISGQKHSRPRRNCSWIRKRKYKKKLIRRFLSTNPSLDYSKMNGFRYGSGIYLRSGYYDNGIYEDPKMFYSFNPYTKVYLSPRGDLRKYCGDVFRSGSSFALGYRDKNIAVITKRRIRRRRLDETSHGDYTYCRKTYSPIIDDIW